MSQKALNESRRSSFAQSEGYRSFRTWVALQQINVGRNQWNDKNWQYYDWGPKNKDPLVMISGISGTAAIFYQQFLSLCPKGIRIISVQYAPYDTITQWVRGFDRFLEQLGLNKIHLFGAAFGGYLAQCYIKQKPEKVLSLILCNSFCDTQVFHDNAPCAGMFTWMPEFVLKRIILSNLPTGYMEPRIADSVDFVVEQLEVLTQKELASRLGLNCCLGNLKPDDTISDEKTTIIDCSDEVNLPVNLREEVYKFYPGAKQALLKTGGNFPFLSRNDEVNLHIEVHLRNRGGLMVRPSSPAPNITIQNVEPTFSTSSVSMSNKEEDTPPKDSKNSEESDKMEQEQQSISKKEKEVPTKESEFSEESDKTEQKGQSPSGEAHDMTSSSVYGKDQYKAEHET